MDWLEHFSARSSAQFNSAALSSEFLEVPIKYVYGGKHHEVQLYHSAQTDHV
jgi:hypothetical protein